jgi:uncharacterized integral membrane protein
VQAVTAPQAKTKIRAGLGWAGLAGVLILVVIVLVLVLYDTFKVPKYFFLVWRSKRLRGLRV